MSKLPKEWSFDRGAIDRIKNIDDVKRMFTSIIRELDLWYSQIYDQIENGGMSTPNWDIREATAADVTAGNAKVKGNLIVKHKTSGAKDEFEA